MKDLNYYQKLEYPVRIEPDPEGGFVASIPDLPGCMSFGESKQEAVANIEDSKNDWLESYHAIHGEAPEPRQTTDFSGRLLLRLPKYLHQRLHEQAAEEDVSLNQYIVLLLTESSVLNIKQYGVNWQPQQFSTDWNRLTGLLGQQFAGPAYHQAQLENTMQEVIIGHDYWRQSGVWNRRFGKVSEVDQILDAPKLNQA